MPEDFEKFGRGIWDAAINYHLKDVIYGNIEIPVELDDGGIFSVKISAPMYSRRTIQRTKLGMVYKYEYGYKNSKGEIIFKEL